LAGISRATFYNWVNEDESFALQVEAAEGEVEREMVGRVLDAARSGPHYWAAAMTYLERRHPEEWSRQDRIRHQFEGQVRLDVRPMLASPEQIEHIAALEALHAREDRYLPAVGEGNSDGSDDFPRK
jgi:hypothetical protein